MNLTWTEAMLAAAKWNERPFGLAKGAMIETPDGGQMSVAELIHSAWREGAEIQCYEGGIWKMCEPFWNSGSAYRVHSDWQPEPAKSAATVEARPFPPCAVTHCPFRRESP